MSARLRLSEGLASAAISYGGRFDKERLAPHAPVHQHTRARPLAWLHFEWLRLATGHPDCCICWLMGSPSTGASRLAIG
jgi:hypothetical protein